MAGRKISVAAALEALHTHGFDVSVKRQSEIIRHPMDTQPESKISIVSKDYVKITLYAQHNRSNSGQTKPGTKTIVGSSAVSYGPGVVTVPVYLAASLLKQDQVTRLGDERTRSTEQRSFLIVQRQGLNGHKAKVALQVPNELLDSGIDLSNTIQSNEHNVRTM